MGLVRSRLESKVPIYSNPSSLQLVGRQPSHRRSLCVIVFKSFLNKKKSFIKSINYSLKSF